MTKHFFRRAKNKINSYWFGHKTYAQNGEDRNIAPYFPLGYKINYLDIGCNHPIRLSNTYLLYKEGGSGVCVDADYRLGKLFKIFRPRDKFMPVGVGTSESKLKFYFISDPALNTTSYDEAQKCIKAGYKIVQEKEVPIRNINNIIEEEFLSKNRSLDFLSIDVEGIDEEVLYSLDLNKYKPTLLCVETGKFMDSRLDKKNRVDKYMEENNYRVIFYNPNNTIYINKEYFFKYTASLGVTVDVNE